MELLSNATFRDVYRAQVYLGVLVDELTTLVGKVRAIDAEGRTPNRPQLPMSKLGEVFEQIVQVHVDACDMAVAVAATSDFQRFRGREREGDLGDRTPSSGTWYERYVQDPQHGLCTIHQRCVELLPSIRHQLRQAFTAIAVACRRLVLEDWCAIVSEQENLGLDIGPLGSAAVISSVCALEADAHSGGGPLLIAIAAASPAPQRLVYKPRGEAGMQWFGRFIHEAFQTCDPDTCCRYKPVLPYVLVVPHHDPSVGAHAWVSFVLSAPTPCGDESDGMYQRHAGALVALASCAGLTDGHFSNIIRCGTHPVLVDAETVLTPTDWESSRCRTPRALILATGLVQDLKALRGHDGILRGATSAFQTRCANTFFRPTIQSDGCDDMRVEFMDVLPAPQAQDSTSPYVGLFSEAFFDGFAATLHIIKASGLLERGSNVSSSSSLWQAGRELKHRLILRPTTHYHLVRYNLLLACGNLVAERDDDLVRKAERRSNVASMIASWRPLLPSGVTDEATASIIEALETEDLLQGNVPVWWLNETTLMLHRDDQQHPCAGPPPPPIQLSDMACLGGVGAALEGMRMLLSNVDAAVEALRRIVSPTLCGPDVPLRLLDMSNTREVMALLKRSAVDYWMQSGRGGAAGASLWATASFYNGSLGVACALAAGGERSTALDLVHDLLEACHQSTPTLLGNELLQVPIGIGGVGGLVYGLSVLLALVTKHHDGGAVVRAALSALLAAVACLLDHDGAAARQRSKAVDVINGVAGLVLGLTKVAPSAFAAVLVARAADLLLAQQRPDGAIWPQQACDASPHSGLSHGQSGIAYALVRAAVYLNVCSNIVGESDSLGSLAAAPPVATISACLVAADKALSYEDAWLFDGTASNWRDLRPNADPLSVGGSSWCHGRPGILLCRGGIRSLLDPPGALHSSGCAEADAAVRALCVVRDAESDALRAWVLARCAAATGDEHSPPQRLDDICCGTTGADAIFVRVTTAHAIEGLPSEDWRPAASRTPRLAHAWFHTSCLFKGAAGMWWVLHRGADDDTVATRAAHDILLFA